jgi:type IV pilus assembly protein PilA
LAKTNRKNRLTRYVRLKKCGFTLIELLVVVAVLGVLVALAVPIYTSNTESTKITTDEANLRILNLASAMYRIDSGVLDGDLFAGVETDNERIQKLVNMNYLTAPVMAQHPNHRFSWDSRVVSAGGQLWRLTNGDNVEYKNGELITYNFSMISEGSKNDFIIHDKYNRPWDFIDDIGLKAGKFRDEYDSEHRLFREMPFDEYEITINAALGEADEIRWSGYGIMFDTALDSKNIDTGYILQFDRGFGKNGDLVIHRRIDAKTGGQDDAVYKYVADGNGVLPSRVSDPEWWEEEKKVTLQVTNVEPASNLGNNKMVNVLIQSKDGTEIQFDWAYYSQPLEDTNYIGLRTWRSGTDNAVFKDLKIQELVR